MKYKISGIDNSVITVQTDNAVEKFDNLMHRHIVFEEKDKNIVTEITSIKKLGENYELKLQLVGEIKNGNFSYGIQSKPSINSNMRFLTPTERQSLLGSGIDKLKIGTSTVYDEPIEVDINQMFSNHFAILGSTGSGKSYAIATMIQNLFSQDTRIPYNANIFIFDAYGEYRAAFEPYFEKDRNINFKLYTTDLYDKKALRLEIPVWLLDMDDWALLLGATDPSQLPIISKALDLVKIFKSEKQETMEFKNHILASAILDIVTGGQKPTLIRDQVFSVLTNFNTPELNLESKVVQPGWTRTFRQCFVIDLQGKLVAVEQITEFLMSFIKPEIKVNKENTAVIPKFALQDFKEALDFAMISEGILKSDIIYSYANVLKVRLETLINSDYGKYFTSEGTNDVSDFIKKLVHTVDGEKVQLVNISINNVDDRFAKNITKIYSKMLFKFSRNLKPRASKPIHIILEEAHRYVQNDSDINLLGYNIFERIAKEGRKFGILLGLITQRPSELSATVISQCNNFMLFKLIHPKDIEFVKEVIPDISANIMEKITYLPTGDCISFGSAFKIPLNTKIGKANPEPFSSNCDVEKLWFEKPVIPATQTRNETIVDSIQKDIS